MVTTLTTLLTTTDPADEREDLHVLLITKQGDALVDVTDQNEVLDRTDRMDVDLGVDECHSPKSTLLQLPYVDLAINRTIS